MNGEKSNVNFLCLHYVWYYLLGTCWKLHLKAHECMLNLSIVYWYYFITLFSLLQDILFDRHYMHILKYMLAVFCCINISFVCCAYIKEKEKMGMENWSEREQGKRKEEEEMERTRKKRWNGIFVPFFFFLLLESQQLLPSYLVLKLYLLRRSWQPKV